MGLVNVRKMKYIKIYHKLWTL